jgi:hypothetical protein
LAERSPSENNIRSSQRPSRRLSKLRRSFSASSSQPAAYETIQHNKSVSVSPHKGLKDTPEWKRYVKMHSISLAVLCTLFLIQESTTEGQNFQID